MAQLLIFGQGEAYLSQSPMVGDVAIVRSNFRWMINSIVVKMMVSLKTRNETNVAVKITLNVAVHFEMHRWKKSCCLRSRYMVIGDLEISLLYPKNKDKRKGRKDQMEVVPLMEGFELLRLLGRHQLGVGIDMVLALTGQVGSDMIFGFNPEIGAFTLLGEGFVWGMGPHPVLVS
ncbi:hypothetical protein TIFTF001_022546 [Ficus carica]|uniref:Uncharacterized protein n=1 Tax=Ficus carica TaxID=3494 RepID=A0AA88ACT2_FICCA|nr:hypothetical protein TIFTF001_022546 [Ficus carica]